MDEKVEQFLTEVPDARRRADARKLCDMLEEATGEPPSMWARGIVGFGRYSYRYASGHSGEAAPVSFAPRKQHLVLYLCSGFEDDEAVALLRKLGSHKTGKGCLYLARLDTLDQGALLELVARSVRAARAIEASSKVAGSTDAASPQEASAEPGSPEPASPQPASTAPEAGAPAEATSATEEPNG